MSKPIRLGILLAAMVAASQSQLEAAERNQNRFQAFVDDYYQSLFAWDPTQATYAGIHSADDRLANLSAPNVARRVQALKNLRDRLQALQAKKLTDDERIDSIVLDHAIQAELLDLQVVRDWKRNPVLYLTKPAEAIDLLMKRSFASSHERVQKIIGRLRATPPLLAALKANVENPPKEFADLALIVAKGSVSFFKTDLADWAHVAAAKDAKLLADFQRANTAVIAGFEEITKWIESDLLPKAKGSYAIGADNFVAKLAAEEMLDIPLDKLLAIGEANLKRDRDAFLATAAKIDSRHAAKEVLARLTEDHPAPDALVAATKATIERTRQFLIDKKIVTVPSEVRPTIAETPPFMRTGGFASMDTPGAYETKATEAFYYVTPPETNWSRAESPNTCDSLIGPEWTSLRFTKRFRAITFNS